MALIISPPPEYASVYCCRREAPAKVISKRNPTSASRIAVTRNVNRGVGFRVCLSVKDLEDAEVLNLGNNAGLYRELSATVKEQSKTPLSSSKQSKEEEEKRNYYLNTGYAIRTLREDFPALFLRELSFDIYRDDIVFKDPLNTFAGIENYKSIFWALRFHGGMFFRALWIDVISVWQPVDNMIIVRWTVHGVPRVPWESHSRFDGTSEYKLDKNGKIYEHRVHNIALHGPSKFKVLAVQEIIQLIGCSSTPKPTYFEISSPSFRKIMAQVKFTGIGHYVSSILTGFQDSDAESDQRS